MVIVNMGDMERSSSITNARVVIAGEGYAIIVPDEVEYITQKIAEIKNVVQSECEKYLKDDSFKKHNVKPWEKKKFYQR
jgi:nitrate/TMAO reductase-like tetraheme cytochrome c subunit